MQGAEKKRLLVTLPDEQLQRKKVKKLSWAKETKWNKST